MQLNITENNQKQLPKIFQKVGIPDIPPVDKWYPPLEDQIFKESKGVIIAPIHISYNMPENNHIDYFHMTPKKCYNSDTKVDKNGVLKIGFREHLVIYLNYFEKFYDRNHYLLSIYSKIKWCIDCL